MEISEEICFSLMAALICVCLKMLKGNKVGHPVSKSGECLDIKCAKTFCVDPIATNHPQTMFHPRTNSTRQMSLQVVTRTPKSAFTAVIYTDSTLLTLFISQLSQPYKRGWEKSSF